MFSALLGLGLALGLLVAQVSTKGPEVVSAPTLAASAPVTEAEAIEIAKQYGPKE